jgi:hypothetical protein
MTHPIQIILTRQLAGYPADVHIENVRYAFFAPGNDPTVWRLGW